MQWVSGRVEKVLVGDFKFSDRFEDLDDTTLTHAIQVVNAQFSGIYSLWSFLPRTERKAKRELCINYLIAWWIANSYPDKAVGVSSAGAMALKSKRIDTVQLVYRDSVRQAGSGVLDSLTTNEFGLQALAMIQTAPEMYLVY